MIPHSEEIQKGKIGAKRQSWNKDNPRDLLLRFISMHPDCDQESLLEKFADKVLSNEGILRTIIEYWFTNNYRSIVHASTPEKIKTEKAKKSHEELETVLAMTKKKVEDKIIEKAEELLMDIIAPTGKPWGDHTGKELIKMGGKFAKAGAKIGTKTVRESMNENQLRALFS